MEIRKHRLKLWQLVLLAIPPLWYLIMIALYSVNIVFWDSWEIVKLYESIQNNGFSLVQMFSQHNEHRIFFPRLIILGTVLLTNWNEKACTFVSAGITIITYVLIIKWVYATFRNFSENRKALLCFLCGALIFSPVQWQNTLWGFQVGFTMVCQLPVWSFYCSWKYDETRKARWLAGMLIWAVGASFSSLQGLVVWPVYLAMLVLKLLTKEKIDKRKLCATGIVAAAALFPLFLYLNGFHFMEAHSQYAARSLVTMAGFVCVNLGAFLEPVVKNSYFVAVIGCAVALASLVIFIKLLREKRFHENWFPGCMVIFGYGVLLMTSLGRASSAAAVSRYQSFILLVLTGLLLLWADEAGILCKKSGNTAAKHSKMIIKGGTILITALLILPHAIYLAPENYPRLREERQEGQIILKQYKRMSNGAITAHIYPWWTENQLAYEAIEPLAKRKMNVFGIEEESVEATAAPYAITGVSIRGAKVTIEGTVSDTAYNDEYRLVTIEYKDELYPAGLRSKAVGHSTEIPFFVTVDHYDISDTDASLILKVFTLKQGEIYSMPINAVASAPLSKSGSVEIKTNEELDYSIDETGNARMDAEKKVMEVSRGDVFTVDGWCVNKTREQLPQTVYLQIEDTLYTLNSYTRSDVAVYFGIPAYENAGYSGIIDTSSFMPGEYSLMLVGLNGDGTYVCMNPAWTLLITGK